ncbi:MAG: phage tail protein [Lachnospiraceae bacterium]|nr:phage tail protein [Lachnospiraceae bacterium]
MVTVEDANDSLYCYTNMENTMTCLKKDLVDDLGGFFRIRHDGGVRYLDYLEKSQNTNSQVIRFGENLMDFTSNIDVSEIATAVIPLGAKMETSAVEGLETRLTIESVNDGQDYVYSADAVELYGWIYKTVIWDDVTLPQNLKSKGEKFLAETQFENMVIEAKAVDLHLTDKDIESFKISDQIMVVSAPHGLNRYFRLTKQTLNLNNPEKDTITLGKDERVPLSARTSQASEEIKKTLEKIVPTSTILNKALKNATELIASAMGGYVVKNNSELLIMDTDDINTATNVWRWNINGLGYSSNGYKGPYELAMTMDGKIVADFIASGTMYADRIKGGTLKLGGANNGNGLMQVYDENGDIIGFWDNTGIRIQSPDKSDLCDINSGYIYFKKYGKTNGAVGANLLTSAGNTYNTMSFRSLGDMIVFSQNTDPYYIINPKNKLLSDNKYTENHHFKGSIRSTDYIIAPKLKLSNGVEIYPGTWLDAISALISNNLYVYGAIGCSGVLNADGANITGNVCAGSLSTDVSISADGNIYSKGDVNACDLVCEDSVYVGGIRLQAQEYDSNNALVIQGGLYAYGSLGCSGTKYRVVDTEHYGKVGMSAFETCEPYFADIGSATIADNGEARIEFDPIFAETIDMESEYQVFLTRTSQANIEWVDKQDGFFVVHGDPGATFDWKLCCKQKGYSDIRMAPINIEIPKKKESEENG